MYITHHKVESSVEEIMNSSFSIQEYNSLDIYNESLLFVSQDEDRIVCFACVKENTKIASVLTNIVIDENYTNLNIEIGLINYIVSELKMQEKHFLVINKEMKTNNTSWIKEILGNNQYDNIAIKIN